MGEHQLKCPIQQFFYNFFLVFPYICPSIQSPTLSILSTLFLYTSIILPSFGLIGLTLSHLFLAHNYNECDISCIILTQTSNNMFPLILTFSFSF